MKIFGGGGWVVCLSRLWSSRVEEWLDARLRFLRWFDVVKRVNGDRFCFLKKKRS